jgi:RNA polymerase sigma-70 factor (ECF subfamily)
MSRESLSDTTRWGPQFHSLLSAAAAGSEWAWEEIYDGLAPTVLGYLRARGAPDAEDLLGETFLHAVRMVRTFDGDERAFRSWVLAIAHRRLADDFRYRARRPQVAMPPEELAPLTEAVSDVADIALERSAVRDVLLAIQELSPDQQDVLVLRFVAGLSLVEVGAVLDKRVPAVKALQRRGLASLHRRISLLGVSR